MSRRTNWDKINALRRRQRAAKPAPYYRARLRLNAQPRLSRCDRLLRVTRADGFDAKAVWRWITGKWVCVQADPGLSWMKGLSPEVVGKELAARKFSYRWFRPSVKPKSQADVHGLPRPHRAGRGTLNIKPHENRQAGSGRIQPQRVKLREIAPSSTSAMAESAALKHGSLRGSEREKPLSGESSSASVSLRSTMPPVPTAVCPKGQES
jgi:hypothetical protein